MTTLSFPQNTPVQFIPGMGRRTAHVLHSLGIYTAGQLQHIPEKVLIELFGPSIRDIFTLVHGKTAPVQQKKEATKMTGTVPESKKQNSFFRRLHLAAQFVSVL